MIGLRYVGMFYNKKEEAPATQTSGAPSLGSGALTPGSAQQPSDVTMGAAGQSAELSPEPRRGSGRGHGAYVTESRAVPLIPTRPGIGVMSEPWGRSRKLHKLWDAGNGADEASSGT